MAQPSVSQIATGFNPTTGVINPDAVVASGPSVSDIAAANAAPAVPATTSVGKFLQDPSLGTGVKAAANNVGPLLGAAQIGEVISAGSPAATPQSQSGNTTAGQTPISTIAAAASPSMSAFEPAINDWTRSQELAIRSRFANLGLTGSPMELSSIERSASGAQDRGTMIFDSMSQLGVSDPMIFSSLLNSNFTTADQINQALLSGKIAV